jgi:glycosyltransferase involved in cell wall biosynthesis
MNNQRTTNRREVLTIIPAYNEGRCIKQVIEDVNTYSDQTDILVVDDGSSDDTSRQVLSTHADLLRLPCNLGVGAALQVALQFA